MSTDAATAATSDLGDGIAQIRLPMAGNPLRYINGYVVEDDGGLTLIDCGWKAADVLAALEAGLRELGHALADLRRIVITHHHFDHYGLAGTLRRAGVRELLMHARDWERAQTFSARRVENDRASDAWLARNGFVARDSADEGLDARWELAEPTRLLGDGECAGRLEAIWTPGHSPGHLCLVDTRSGRMFTGDHILKPITPHVGLWNDGDGDPMGDYVASLNKVRGRGAAGALPAHGEPFPNLDRRIDELLAHAAQRDGQILSALKTGASNAAEVAQRLPWTRRNRSFDDLGEWDRQFAISETIAHLHHLNTRNLIAREEAPGPIRYRAK